MSDDVAARLRALAQESFAPRCSILCLIRRRESMNSMRSPSREIQGCAQTSAHCPPAGRADESGESSGLSAPPWWPVLSPGNWYSPYPDSGRRGAPDLGAEIPWQAGLAEVASGGVESWHNYK
jgi:hypothetical protein